MGRQESSFTPMPSRSSAAGASPSSSSPSRRRARSRARSRSPPRACKEAEGTLVNPATGRCVKATGRIGRRLQLQAAGGPSCAAGAVLNPASNRCVKATGRVARKVLRGAGDARVRLAFVDRSDRADEDVAREARRGELRHGTLVLTAADAYPSRPAYFLHAVVRGELRSVGEEFYNALMDVDAEQPLRDALERHFPDAVGYEEAVAAAFAALGYE